MEVNFRTDICISSSILSVIDTKDSIFTDNVNYIEVNFKTGINFSSSILSVIDPKSSMFTDNVDYIEVNLKKAYILAVQFQV